MPARRTTTQKSHMFVADFETCDSSELSQTVVDGQNLYKQRVWLAGLKNLETMQSQTFTSLDDFMQVLLGRGNNQNKEVAFHNLRFDGSFIIPWLFANGYTSTQEKPQAKEFSVLVSEQNQWYSMTIQATKRRKVTIWDSAKLFPMPLEYMPDVYHTPTRKIQEDSAFYNRVRPEGYTPTEQELSYLENDLGVLAETINAHIDVVGIRFKKTQASQAFHDFTKSFPAWNLRFPPLDTEHDKEIRPAYWGGISYVPPSKAGKTYKGIGVMDINSSYPHKASACKMPYGDVLKTTEGEHPDSSKFWIADVLIRFTLKDNKVPCIPKKSITEQIPNTKEKWLHDSEGIVRMKLNSIDYTTISWSYDFEVIKWIKSWHYKHRVHRELTKFIDTNNTIKVESKRKSKLAKSIEEKRTLLSMSYRAKITNNSFYGKFGEEIIKESKTPYFDEETEGVTWLVDRVQELTDGKKKYLPVAIAITAYGRQQLVELANALGDRFLYCDTDSVHYLTDGGQEIIDDLVDTGKLWLDPVELGAWDVEGYHEKGRFLRAKCYIEGGDEKRYAAVAGLPADPHTGQFSKSRSCLTWENFHIGHVVPATESNKLRTARTETGDKLLPIEFTITDHASFMLT